MKRLKAGNSCYYSVQTLLSSCLLSKNLKIKIYKTKILAAVLYGCGTLSLIVREEHRLRVFENRILRRIFGPKKDGNGEWRRLPNEELHSLYRSSNIVRVIKSRRLRWGDYAARMEEGRNAFIILTGKFTGNRPLGRPRRRWEDNIKMDLKEIGINTKNMVNSAQDKDLLDSPCEFGIEPPGSISHGIR
jgi:hypothetical protein